MTTTTILEHLTAKAYAMNARAVETRNDDLAFEAHRILGAVVRIEKAEDEITCEHCGEVVDLDSAGNWYHADSASAECWEGKAWLAEPEAEQD